ncbi:hypothetical protein ACFX2A_015330 [Malus domestica]
MYPFLSLSTISKFFITVGSVLAGKPDCQPIAHSSLHQHHDRLQPKLIYPLVYLFRCLCLFTSSSSCFLTSTEASTDPRGRISRAMPMARLKILNWLAMQPDFISIHTLVSSRAKFSRKN